MSRSVGRVFFERAALAAIASVFVPASVDAQLIDKECFCYAKLNSFGSQKATPVGRNMRFLIDGGSRFDIRTLTFWDKKPIPGVRLQADVEPFFDTGMYVLVPAEPLEFQHPYGVTVYESQDPFADGAADGFYTGDFEDNTPPVIGDLRVTGKVFTNDCGAKALYTEDSGTWDDRGHAHRFHVLVEMRQGAKTFNTVSSTYGVTSEITENVISKAPYLGKCITDQGLETIGFEFGVDTKISLTVYDYVGNASETKTQTIAWPISVAEPSSSRCSISVDSLGGKGERLPLVIWLVVTVGLVYG